VDDQLSLSLEDGRDPSSDVPSRLGFAVATEGGRPFDDDSFFFEPWWPGTHAHLRLLGGHAALHVEHLSDPLVTFPRLAEDLAAIPADGLIAEGTLLALDADGRPDARLLRQRLSGSGTQEGEGAFVASDLIYVEGRSLARKPFVERRRQLASVIGDTDLRVVGRGLLGEGTTLARAAASMGLEAVSARRLDAHWKSGAAGDGWLRLAVSQEASAETPPLMVLLERLPLEG